MECGGRSPTLEAEAGRPQIKRSLHELYREVRPAWAMWQDLVPKYFIYLFYLFLNYEFVSVYQYVCPQREDIDI